MGAASRTARRIAEAFGAKVGFVPGVSFQRVAVGFGSEGWDGGVVPGVASVPLPPLEAGRGGGGRCRASLCCCPQFVDADNVLTNPDTLGLLMAENKTVVAPMLDSRAAYSNFWCGMTAQVWGCAARHAASSPASPSWGSFLCPLPLLGAALLIFPSAEWISSSTSIPQGGFPHPLPLLGVVFLIHFPSWGVISSSVSFSTSPPQGSFLHLLPLLAVFFLTSFRPSRCFFAMG